MSVSYEFDLGALVVTEDRQGHAMTTRTDTRGLVSLIESYGAEIWGGKDEGIDSRPTGTDPRRPWM